MINFSLIVPTRGRLEVLRDLLTSIKKTTYDSSSIEVFLVCDNDDQEMLHAIKPFGDEYDIVPLRFVIQPRETEQWVNYINGVLPLIKGQYVIPLNDDVLFMTQHWDKKLLEKLENYLADKPDRIVYGRTHGDKWNERPYFWYDKEKSLWFKVDLEKHPITAEYYPKGDKILVHKPSTEGIIVTREGREIMIKADPIIWEGKEYRPLKIYHEHLDGKLMCIYGEKVPVRFTCFPAVSREAIDVLGHLFSPSCSAHGADFIIAKIYSDVDRVLDVPEVTIRHLHMMDDAIHNNIERMSAPSNWFFIADHITKDVEKLKKHIELCKKDN